MVAVGEAFVQVAMQERADATQPFALSGVGEFVSDQETVIHETADDEDAMADGHPSRERADQLQEFTGGPEHLIIGDGHRGDGEQADALGVLHADGACIGHLTRGERFAGRKREFLLCLGPCNCLGEKLIELFRAKQFGRHEFALSVALRLECKYSAHDCLAMLMVREGGSGA